jgi:hypothetical protein
MPLAGLLLGLLGLALALLYTLLGQVEIQPVGRHLPEDGSVFQFGPAQVLGASVFHRSSLSLAFVNKKPVVPGHVLVVPDRPVASMEQLKEEEVTDLFLLVQKVDTFLQRHYSVDSTTISIQSKC